MLENQGIELCLTFSEGGYSYLNESGVVTSGGNGYNYITDYIPANFLRVLKYKLGINTGGPKASVIAAYDNAKTFIAEKSVITEGNNDIKQGLFIADENVAYIRICFNSQLNVSCITSPKIPYMYEEDVNEKLKNLELTTNQIKDKNKKNTQDIINEETDISIHFAKILGLSPYGVFLTKDDFVLNQNYDNNGNKYNSSVYKSTRPIKIKLSSFFNYLYFSNSTAYINYYNIALFWADDPEINGYSGDNKLYNFAVSPNVNVLSKYIDISKIGNERNFVFVSFTIPSDNLSDNTVVSFGLYNNTVQEKNEELDFMLGSLKKRINLVSEILDGYQVVNGQVTVTGGVNYKTYVIKVQSGKTYYFYKKLSDNSVQSISLSWATKNKNKLKFSEASVHYGKGENATMQEGDEYLYVGVNKSENDLMISEEEQTKYYPPENLAYIEIQDLKDRIAILEENTEEDDNTTIFGFNYLNKQPLEKDYKGTDYTISEPSNTSQISDYTDYPALYGSDSLNPIFRFSSPACRIRTELYPNNLVFDDRTPGLGFTIEFYCSASSFEIMGFTNAGAGVIVNGEILGFKSATVSATNYIYVNLGTAQKRLIRLYVNSNTFYGIRCNNDGEITAFDKKRFLCAFDGDSVVEGSNSDTKAGRWAQIASTLNDFDCLNCAMGGTGYGQDLASSNRKNMIDRFQDQIAKFNPDILVVSAGINDANEGFDTYVDNYYSQAKQLLPNCKIIVCSNYYNNPETENDSWTKAEAKCEILRKTALKYELPFIDYLHRLTYDALGNLITNNIGTNVNTNLITDENYSQFIDKDNDVTHPTQYGHTIMGKYIGGEIYKVIKDLKGFV